jgi:hypothetical protein
MNIDIQPDCVGSWRANSATATFAERTAGDSKKVNLGFEKTDILNQVSI